MNELALQPSGDLPEAPTRTLVLGNVSLNLDSFRAQVDGKRVQLTYHEFELLRNFCEQQGRVIAYETLAQELWGMAGNGAVRHLHVIVHRLRAKLAGASPYTIETVRGRGYGMLRASE